MQKNKKAVITGDVINSRAGNMQDWNQPLKMVLQQYGQNPGDWEMYRGDSFQLAMPPEQALFAAIHIKAAIKQIKNYDVRMAIGVGEEREVSKTITESNGTAYVYSGTSFDQLKNKTLAFKSGHKELTIVLNLMINLAMLVANQWSNTVAGVIKKSMEHPELTQKQLAQLLGKSQSSISEALKRGGFDEIMKLNDFYQSQIF